MSTCSFELFAFDHWLLVPTRPLLLGESLTLHFKDWPDEDLNSEDLSPLLLSLRFFKAIYRHQSDPASYIYDALRHYLKCSVCETELSNTLPAFISYLVSSSRLM